MKTLGQVTAGSFLAPTDEETEILGGIVVVAKYGLPGTKKLCRHVEAALERGCSAVLMEKHGALITGEDRETAFKLAGLRQASRPLLLRQETDALCV
ncbi:MAG: class II aldolase/adducin family protein [Clostridiales Family XIII bacterium]|nr:class II aldolase/adducin family protein [Clostridiales Family XIII bacterium]